MDRSKTPLPAPEYHTVPMFCSGNNPYKDFGTSFDREYGTAPALMNNNSQTISSEKWTYFGAFLNVYDPANMINLQDPSHPENGKRILDDVLASTHHCIVAQIAYDGAPIVPASYATTANTDKLAQRNIMISLSDNPGSAATHMVPQTFDLRPSPPPKTPPPGELVLGPNELMIDWGLTPPGSAASFYWPQIDAVAVVKLAAVSNPTQLFTVVDPHTIQCLTVTGTTYIPIPTTPAQAIAGLLTIDLPLTVVKGQYFEITIRRASMRKITLPSIPNFTGGLDSAVPAAGPAATAAKHRSRHPKALHPPPPTAQPRPGPGFVLFEQFISGKFQLRISVRTADTMLSREENTLAIFKHRLSKWSPTDRWYPVLVRYISYLGARVDGLGGAGEA